MRYSFLVAILLNLALAFDVSTSLEVRVGAAYLPATGSFALEPAYAGSLLASANWREINFEAALYPSWRLDTRDLETGISKLEIEYDGVGYALGLGASPESLATLRLLPPFDLERPATDYAKGFWGGWAEYYPDPALRLRLALRRVDRQPTGLLRIDGQFPGSDYRLAVVYGPDPAPAALGTGFSTRLGNFVFYGEVWRLLRAADPWRGGAGGSFYVFDGLLSAEAAYSDGWHTAAAYNWQPVEDWTVSSLARLDWHPAGATTVSAAVHLDYLADTGDVNIGIAFRHDAAGTVWLPSLGARVYY